MLETIGVIGWMVIIFAAGVTGGFCVALYVLGCAVKDYGYKLLDGTGKAVLSRDSYTKRLEHWKKSAES
jgi:hypothetical protein